MEATMITDRSRQLIGSLSKGLKQRVGLAQALIHDPDILILDEPTIGLDPRQIAEIRTLIHALAGKRTVILSSHILSEVQAICSRVMIINGGKLIAADSPDALAAKLQRQGTVTVTIGGASESIESGLVSLEESDNVAIHERLDDRTTFIVTPGEGKHLRKSIAGLIGANNWELFEFSEASLSLEQVYLKLIDADRAAIAKKTVVNSDDEVSV
jgi:ABC-2 type transport system ATP-binding protein